MITFIPSSPARQALNHLVQIAVINRMVDLWQKEARERIQWTAQAEQEIATHLFATLRSTFATLMSELPKEYLTPGDLRTLLERLAAPNWHTALQSFSSRKILLADTVALFLAMREVVFKELESIQPSETCHHHLVTLVFDWIIEKAIQAWEEERQTPDRILSIGSMEINQLRTIVESVRSPVDLHPVFQTIVERVRNSGIWPMCAIGITDPEAKEIVVPAQSGFAEDYPRDIKFPAVGSATLETLRRNQPIAITDVANDTEFPVLQEAAKAAGYRSILLVPLSIKDIRAVVTFGSPEPHEFTQDEILLANAIAQQVMIAIENAHQYEREKQRVEELESLNQLIADQNRLLQRVAETHASLIQLVLNDAGMDAILKAIRKLLGNPVTIENEHFQLLEYSQDWEFFDPHRRLSIQAGRTAPDVLNHPELSTILNELRKNRRAVLIPPLPTIGIEKRRIVAPIIAGGEILGYIWVMEALRSFNDQDIITTEQSSVILALEMVKQRAATETEMRLKASFFEDILFKETYVEGELLQKASYLGYQFNQPTLMLLFECSSPTWTSDNVRSREQRNRKIFLAIQSTVDQARPENIVALQSGQVVVMTPLLKLDEDPHPVAFDLAERVRQDLKQVESEIMVLAASGGVCQSISGVREVFRQARRTIGAARSLGRLDESFSLSDLGIYGILYREGEKGELQAFARTSLQPLLQYDQQNGTELIKTLETYLAYQGKISESARKLYIHANTLRQRIERIEDVLGVNIDDPQVRLNLQVAIRILQVASG